MIRLPWSFGYNYRKLLNAYRIFVWAWKEAPESVEGEVYLGHHLGLLVGRKIARISYCGVVSLSVGDIEIVCDDGFELKMRIKSGPPFRIE